MLFMLFLHLRVDENFIDEYYDKRVERFTKDHVYEIHKCSRCIRETKLHIKEFIEV